MTRMLNGGEIPSTYQGSYDVYVRDIGSGNYLADGSFGTAGNYRVTDNDLADIWGWAKALKSENLVMGIGPGVFNTSTISFDDDGQSIYGSGRELTQIYLKNGVNDNVMEYGAGATRIANNKIKNLYINGNTTNNTAGSCIYWDYTAAGAPAVIMGWWLELEGLTLKYADDYGLYMNTDSCSSPQTRIVDLRSYNNDASPEILLDRIYDSLFDQIWTSSMTLQGGCSSSHLSNFYCGGGSASPFQVLGSTVALIATNLRSDNCSQTAIALGSSTQGCYIQGAVSNKQATGAHPAVTNAGDYNTFDLTFYDNASGGISTWDNGFEEAATATYNYYHGMFNIDVCSAYEVEYYGANGSTYDIYRGAGAVRTNVL